MKKNTKNKNNKFFDTKTVVGLIVIYTLTVSLIAVSNRNKNVYVEPQIMEQSEGIISDTNEEYNLNTEYLPLIRLSNYNSETGDREGIVITNNGTIYKYAFNETQVNFPDSYSFALNQTIYLDNIVEEIGDVEAEDLTLLIRYSESIGNEYETTDMVFDTIGNSISVTNYNKEDIYVLINNEGIVNINNNTQLILDILNKYNISL